MKFLAKAIVLLLLMNGTVAAQPAATIPSFTFYKLNEELFTNKNLDAGKMVMFVFFDAECDHCQHAIQYLNQNIKQFTRANIYLVTLDAHEKVNRFMNNYGNNLRGKKNVLILQDRQNEFLSKFKPRKYPSLFLYSAKNKLIMYDDNERNLPGFAKQIDTVVK
ncbi:MAG: redoxin domain-containing protein [Ferruginibacter sp.]